MVSDTQSLFPGAPPELFQVTLPKLHPTNVLLCRLVCKDWEKATRQPTIWLIFAQNYGIDATDNPEKAVLEYVKGKVETQVTGASFLLRDKVFKIGLAQEGKVFTKRGIALLDSKPLQPLTPFPPPPMVPMEKDYITHPGLYGEVFQVAKLNAFVEKRLKRKVIRAMEGFKRLPTLGPDDLRSFQKCLKPLTPMQKLTAFFENITAYFRGTPD